MRHVNLEYTVFTADIREKASRRRNGQVAVVGKTTRQGTSPIRMDEWTWRVAHARIVSRPVFYTFGH